MLQERAVLSLRREITDGDYIVAAVQLQASKMLANNSIPFKSEILQLHYK